MSVIDTSNPQTALTVDDGKSQIDPLLVMVLKNEVPVETVERVIALIEKREERSARESYFAALSEFKKSCKLIVAESEGKIATRGGSGYTIRYAELDTIIEAVTPGLEANGFAFTWDCELTAPTILTTICTLHHVKGHSESSRFPVPTTSSSAMSDQQRHSAAFTFGRRQTLFGVLGLGTTDAGPDKPQDMEAITAEQSANLEALLDETKTDREKFLQYAGVDKLQDIPAGRYSELVALLERKRKTG